MHIIKYPLNQQTFLKLQYYVIWTIWIFENETFQRFIDQVLCDLHFCYAYIDDVLIASTSEEEHKYLVLRFQRYGLMVNLQVWAWSHTTELFGTLCRQPRDTPIAQRKSKWSKTFRNDRLNANYVNSLVSSIFSISLCRVTTTTPCSANISKRF